MYKNIITGMARKFNIPRSAALEIRNIYLVLLFAHEKSLNFIEKRGSSTTNSEDIIMISPIKNRGLIMMSKIKRLSVWVYMSGNDAINMAFAGVGTPKNESD